MVNAAAVGKDVRYFDWMLLETNLLHEYCESWVGAKRLKTGVDAKEIR